MRLVCACAAAFAALHAAAPDARGAADNDCPALPGPDFETWGVGNDGGAAAVQFVESKGASPAAVSNMLGVMKLRGWPAAENAAAEPDHEGARQHFEAAAETDYAPALNNLGVMALNGWGGDADDERAREYFRRAAAADYAPGLSNLGVMALNDRGAEAGCMRSLPYAASDPPCRTSPGPAAALRYLEQAADWNYPPALNTLGVVYIHGEAPGKTARDGLESIERAAALGFAPAWFNLGVEYRRGEIVPRADKDALDKDALGYYTQAAQSGDADAQYELGRMYALGLGAERSIAAAGMRLALAEAGGKADAARRRAALWGEFDAGEAEILEDCASAIVADYEAAARLVGPLAGSQLETLYNDFAAAPELFQTLRKADPPSWMHIVSGAGAATASGVFASGIR